jgi:ribosome-binding protein aMBF1 (putative translation factor)
MKCQFCGARAKFLAIRYDGEITPVCRSCEAYMMPAVYPVLKDFNGRVVDKVDARVFERVLGEVL